jgi:hypothetical protein
MTFSGAGSTVTYESLDCFGDLKPIGFDGAWRVYTELITRGHCTNGGTWRVHVVGPREIETSWRSGAASYTVTAVLTR